MQFLFFVGGPHLCALGYRCCGVFCFTGRGEHFETLSFIGMYFVDLREPVMFHFNDLAVNLH